MARATALNAIRNKATHAVKGGVELASDTWAWLNDSVVERVRRTGPFGEGLADRAENAITLNKTLRGEMEPVAQRAQQAIGLRPFVSRELELAPLEEIGGQQFRMSRLAQAMTSDEEFAKLSGPAQTYVKAVRELEELSANQYNRLGILRETNRSEFRERFRFFDRQNEQTLLKEFKGIARGDIENLVPRDRVRMMDALEQMGMKRRDLEAEDLDTLRHKFNYVFQGEVPEPVDKRWLVRQLAKYKTVTPTPGGKVFRRQAHEDLVNLMQRVKTGETPEQDVIPDALRNYFELLSKLNGVEVGVVHRSMRPYLGKQNIRKVGMEFPRELPVHPTSFVHKGQEIQLLKTNPMDYVRGSVDQIANRAAFATHFGQGIRELEGGNRTIVDMLRQQASVQGVPDHLFDQMTQTLSGVPLQQSLATPGTLAYGLSRNVRDFSNIMKTLMLTRASLMNVFEFFGNMQSMAGVTRTLKAHVDLMKGGRGRGSIHWMEREGIVTKDVMDITFDHTRWGSSAAKVFGNSVLRLFPTKQVWAWQERHAAATGFRLAEDLKRGRAADLDFLTLRGLLGYTDEQASKLFTGKGTDEEYVDLIRRFTARSNVTNLTLPAELATAQNMRHWSNWMWFTRYSNMKAGTMGRMTRVLTEAGSKFWKAPNKQNGKELWQAMRLNARYHVGNAVQGTATIALLEYALGGREGLRLKFRDAVNNEDASGLEKLGSMSKFLGEAWVTSQIGPLLYGVAAIARQNDLSAAFNMSAGASVTSDLVAVLAPTGMGDQHGRPVTERVARFLDRYTAVSKPIRRIMALHGLSIGSFGDEDPELETAIKEFYKFAREEVGQRGTFHPGRMEAEDRNFRQLMRQAYKHLGRSGGLDEHKSQRVREFLREAVYVEGKDSGNIAQSLRQRRMMTRVGPEDRAKMIQWFRARNSEHLLQRLHEHDELLNAWADSLQ